MPEALLSAKEAARRLAISVTTLYDWLGQADYGLLLIRGQRVTICYFQGGPGGQGRIRIEPSEVERIKELMRVVPQKSIPRRPQMHADQFPGITVPLGRPLNSV
ncbi:MAG: helix-turn-helix domain-containing protein [Verrucomicrobiales bacterium]|nr:helix-turn-helix domain-containing protein [Verrucomicrobiales bacterium]